MPIFKIKIIKLNNHTWRIQKSIKSVGEKDVMYLNVYKSNIEGILANIVDYEHSKFIIYYLVLINYEPLKAGC